MKRWLDNLAPRERAVLAVGAIAAAVVLVYGLIWYPLAKDVARLRLYVAEQSEAAEWMRGAAREVEALRTNSASPAIDRRPLLTLVEQTARTAGLGEALNRVEPQGQGSAGVWLQGAAFDDLVGWLAQIDSEFGVRVESLLVDPQDEPGRVNVRLVVVRELGA